MPRASRFLCALASVCAALGSMAADSARARPLDEVVASKTLVVVAYEDNKPFSWTENGEARGIEVEIGRGIARRLGVEASFLLRMQGEEVDDDLRANIWRGPLTGGGVGDVMLRVPVDRELALRNKEAVIGNGYFRETVAVAVHEDLTGPAPSFDTFRNMRIGVQIGTVADYFLMRYANGALIANIDHHLRPEQGAERFAKRQIAALMGLRSHLEPMLAERGAAAKWVEIPAPGLVRAEWVLGTAVKENSRDLHYAIAAALSDMRSSGELAGIFARFGVTYVPPRDPS